jgi:hypothetical protein
VWRIAVIPTEAVRPESVAVLVHRLAGIDLSRCSVCGEGRMQITAIIRYMVAPDTS